MRAPSFEPEAGEIQETIPDGENDGSGVSHARAPLANSNRQSRRGGPLQWWGKRGKEITVGRTEAWKGFLFCPPSRVSLPFFRWRRWRQDTPSQIGVRVGR